MTKIIIEDGSLQTKEFVTYVHKSAAVKSYPPALFSHITKNSYTHFVYPKPFQCKQDIQNTHLNDWIETANKQLIMCIFNSINQEANFDRKVCIFKSYHLQAGQQRSGKRQKIRN